jgi:hypothetical protein
MTNAERSVVMGQGTPKWLRPVDPSVSTCLPVRIDPRLQVDEDTADRLRLDAEPLTALVTVFMTSNYDATLAADIIDDGEHGLHIFVRAATGDEVAWFSNDDAEIAPSPDAESPGDYAAKPRRRETRRRAASASCEIAWSETQHSAEISEPAVVLWSGEVLLTTGQGIAGPFYVDEPAARAWAFSTALSMPSDEVFGGQVVGYLCAESKAASLLAGGDAAFARLNRFRTPPVRGRSVVPFPLPGKPMATE